MQVRNEHRSSDLTNTIIRRSKYYCNREGIMLLLIRDNNKMTSCNGKKNAHLIRCLCCCPPLHLCYYYYYYYTHDYLPLPLLAYCW